MMISTFITMSMTAGWQLSLSLLLDRQVDRGFIAAVTVALKPDRAGYW